MSPAKRLERLGGFLKYPATIEHEVLLNRKRQEVAFAVFAASASKLNETAKKMWKQN